MFLKKRILFLIVSLVFNNFYSGEQIIPAGVFLCDLEHFFQDKMDGIGAESASNLSKLFANDPMRDNIRPMTVSKELKCFDRKPQAYENYYKIEDSGQGAIYHWICTCLLEAADYNMSMIFLIALVARNKIGECFIEMNDDVRIKWINHILSYPRLLQESGMFREFCLWAKELSIEGINLPEDLPEAKVVAQEEALPRGGQEEYPSPSPSVRPWATATAVSTNPGDLLVQLLKSPNPTNTGGTSLLQGVQSERDLEADDEPDPKKPCDKDQRLFRTSESF